MAIQEILVPDVGGGKVDVIEILVKVGDSIEAHAPLLTVESEKASMDIPSPYAGVIKEITVKVGDKLTEGQLIAQIDSASLKATQNDSASLKATQNDSASLKATQNDATPPKEATKPAITSAPVKPASVLSTGNNSSSFKDSLYAGPAVRRIAREFGIDLTQIKGTGEKERITKEDVQNYVRQRLAGGGSSLGFNLAPAPQIDFAKFGPVEIKPLSKINKLTGANLHRNWLTIPHVTQFDEADITDLEAFRVAKKAEFEAQGYKLTLIVFVMKLVVEALKKYPRFNASLDASGENLVLKNYYHIGVAVDTPNGLVVPVIRDVDKKSLADLAKELGEISKKAREKGLTPMEMQGGCFSISSLGGIGGTAFTPIVNAPEVAILGLSKSSQKPVWKDNQFVPRLMLPLSLSYDHRVIDGADAARFVTFLNAGLQNLWNEFL